MGWLRINHKEELVNMVAIRALCKQCGGWGGNRGWCGPCKGTGEVMEQVPDDILRGDRVDLAAHLVGRRLEVMEARVQRNV